MQFARSCGILEESNKKIKELKKNVIKINVMCWNTTVPSHKTTTTILMKHHVNAA